MPFSNAAVWIAREQGFKVMGLELIRVDEDSLALIASSSCFTLAAKVDTIVRGLGSLN